MSTPLDPGRLENAHADAECRMQELICRTSYQPNAVLSSASRISLVQRKMKVYMLNALPQVTLSALGEAFQIAYMIQTKIHSVPVVI